MIQQVQGIDGNFTKNVEFKDADVKTDTIVQLTVHGKLPFAILIPDSLSTTDVKASFPPIAVGLKEYSAELRLIRVLNEDQKRWGISIGIEDIYGDYTYTLFQLKIYSSDPVNTPINKEVVDSEGEIQHELITNFSTKFIHKFIEAYKGVNNSDKDWIPEITPMRLSPWHTMEALNKTGEKIWAMGTADKRGTGNSLGNTLSKQQLTLLQDSLIMKEYVEDPATKYRQMANRFKINRDYNAFCVFVVVFIEHWLFREVRNKLLELGKNTEEIEQLFTYEDKRGKTKNISREDAIKLITKDKNFKNSPAYTDYIDEVVERRDSIVHGRQESLLEKDAEVITNKVNSFVEYITEEFKKLK